MMFSKIGALAIFTLCFLVGQSVQEECAAQAVTNLRLTGRHLLQWSVQPGEPCEIDDFLVYIFHPEQPAEYAFSTKTHYTDVGFLEVCEEWTFAVVPIAGHTTGAQRRIVAKLPLHIDADISLAYLNMHHNPTTHLTHLQWGLVESDFKNCSLQYRVTVEEAGSPVIEDFYVDHNSLDLHFLSSCTTYQFGVRAINTAPPTIEGPLKTETFILPGRRQNAPVLIEFNSTATTIFLSFRLESEVRNPCALRSLFIDGGAAISQTIALSNEDRRNPVNVTIGNLQPSTIYNLDIYVSNTAGWSDPAAVSIATAAVAADLSYMEKEEE